MCRHDSVTWMDDFLKGKLAKYVPHKRLESENLEESELSIK